MSDHFAYNTLLLTQLKSTQCCKAVRQNIVISPNICIYTCMKHICDITRSINYTKQICIHVQTYQITSSLKVRQTVYKHDHFISNEN